MCEEGDWAPHDAKDASRGGRGGLSPLVSSAMDKATITTAFKGVSVVKFPGCRSAAASVIDIDDDEHLSHACSMMSESDEDGIGHHEPVSERGKELDAVAVDFMNSVHDLVGLGRKYLSILSGLNGLHDAEPNDDMHDSMPIDGKQSVVKVCCL